MRRAFTRARAPAWSAVLFLGGPDPSGGGFVAVNGCRSTVAFPGKGREVLVGCEVQRLARTLSFSFGFALCSRNVVLSKKGGKMFLTICFRFF